MLTAVCEAGFLFTGLLVSGEGVQLKNVTCLKNKYKKKTSKDIYSQYKNKEEIANFVNKASMVSNGYVLGKPLWYFQITHDGIYHFRDKKEAEKQKHQLASSENTSSSENLE